MLNLRKCGHKDLERYYSLLEMDFAKEEIISKLSLHRALLNGSAELLVVYDEESNLEVAYALVLTKNLYGYVLLKYMAVLPWYRGKGVGIAAMRLINKRYADRQGIKRGDIILKMDLKDCVTLSAALGHIQDAQTEKRPLHLMIQNAEQDEINVLQLKLRP